MGPAGVAAVSRLRTLMETSAVRSAVLLAVCCMGCSSRPSTVATAVPPSRTVAAQADAASASLDASAERTSHIVPAGAELIVDEEAAPPRELAVVPHDDLPQLEAEAISSNPRLQQLQQQAAAAWQKAQYVGKLPDPTTGLNVFGSPIETAAGSQRANINVMQMIPWLSRLNAREQQACYEALSAEQMYQAARLRVIAEVRTAYYKLYVLGKQLDINAANQQLLQALIDAATARVANGAATQGDVLLGTLELSRLEEQRVGLQQLVVAAAAELNRLRNLSAETPVAVPQQLDVPVVAWRHDELSALAQRRQPEIAAAQLTTQAASWGLEVARLERRPNFSVGAAWYFMDDNRPPSPVVSVGDDAWSLGASVSIPIWHRKNDAMEQEALRRQFAAQFAVSDVIRAYDALLQDLLAQAQAGDETARLYRDTILPQAQQTLEADQQAYSQNAVEFDRVIADVRNLLTLEVGYHRALGQVAIALARLEEAVGGSLPQSSAPEPPPVPVPDPETNEILTSEPTNDLASRNGGAHNTAAGATEPLAHKSDVSQVAISPNGEFDDRDRHQRTVGADSAVLRGLRSCELRGAE